MVEEKVYCRLKESIASEPGYLRRKGGDTHPHRLELSLGFQSLPMGP